MPSQDTSLAADFEQHQRTKAKGKQSWRVWYKSPTWKAIKRHRLSQEPSCRYCAQEGRAVVAVQVDHVDPHLGQWSLFTKYENTQSLCARHYNSRKPSW
jgi:5-methylcytosine-specific restriction enzyme A